MNRIYSFRHRALICALFMSAITPATSAVQTAKEFLEQLQIDAWQKQWGITHAQLESETRAQQTDYLPWCISQYSRLTVQGAIAEQPPEEIRNECQELLDEIPTRYQDPMKFRIVSQRYETIHQAAIEAGEFVEKDPMLATLPGGETNAKVIRESGHLVLVVNDGLIDIGWRLSKIIVLALPDLENRMDDPFGVQWERVLAHLRQRPEIFHRFNDLINAVRDKRHAYFSEPFGVSDTQRRISATLDRGIELFVVGHEYTHVSHRHGEGRLRGRPAQ